jgi:hypothetical protein
MRISRHIQAQVPLAIFLLMAATATASTYTVIETNQTVCYNTQSPITCPNPGETYYGQDAQHASNLPGYVDNGNGTVTDNTTGLTWTQSPDLEDDGDIDVDDKLSFYDALAYPATLNAQEFGGFDDWRLPSMKELYSLMDFSGTDPSGPNPSGQIPFIDTSFFEFGYGDEAAGERIIDAQFWSNNLCLDSVFDGQEAAFGLNLADGRIKGYPTTFGPSPKLNYVYFVRGNTDYGVNEFVDNGDSTITDNATGLMWTQNDRGDGVSNGPRSGLTWVDALDWGQDKNGENYLGYNDWRLPDAKEMQSIVEYSRAPGATSSAAIDPIFNVTQITNEVGQVDYPWYWTSTSHVRSDGSASNAAYVCFGRGMGYMFGSWMDVRGAGCQRSDRKDGDFSEHTYVYDGYYFGIAPQGDAARLYNYVRLVRDVGSETPCCNHDGMRGDVNYDSSGPNIADLTYLVSYLFGSGTIPPCEEEADINADGPLNIADLTYLVAYLFGGGQAPQPCP